MRSLLASMAHLKYLLLVLLLTIFVFAIMGMQLFGGKLSNGQATPSGLNGGGGASDVGIWVLDGRTLLVS